MKKIIFLIAWSLLIASYSAFAASTPYWRNEPVMRGQLRAQGLYLSSAAVSSTLTSFLVHGYEILEMHTAQLKSAGGQADPNRFLVSTKLRYSPKASRAKPKNILSIEPKETVVTAMVDINPSTPLQRAVSIISCLDLTNRLLPIN